MSQLLIIDVQRTFNSSQSIEYAILEEANNYDSVVYLYDVISGEGQEPYDMWEEMAMAHYEGDFNPKILTKEYAFFRNLMDDGYYDEFIVDLGKFFINNNIHDGRDLEDKDEDIKEKYNQVLKNHDADAIDFDSFTFYIPDLKDDLKDNIINGVVLVGDGREECLKEVTLLLDMLDIKYTIKESLCY